MERKEQWINQIMDTEVYINQAKPSQALQARLKRIPNTLFELRDARLLILEPSLLRKCARLSLPHELSEFLS